MQNDALRSATYEVRSVGVASLVTHLLPYQSAPGVVILRGLLGLLAIWVKQRSGRLLVRVDAAGITLDRGYFLRASPRFFPWEEVETVWLVEVRGQDASALHVGVATRYPVASDPRPGRDLHPNSVAIPPLSPDESSFIAAVRQVAPQVEVHVDRGRDPKLRDILESLRSRPNK